MKTLILSLALLMASITAHAQSEDCTKLLNAKFHKIQRAAVKVLPAGHHNVHEFMRKVREEGYSWPLGMPQHVWCRTVPTRDPGYSCKYVICDGPGRGAYPATYVQEAWNDDSYEAITATTTAAEGQP